MPVKSKIVYDPTLSVEENAKKCGVSDNAIRYYIRTRGIDRRYHGKVNVVEELKAYLKEHPNATRAELSRETGHGINTIRRYWEIAHGNGMLTPNEDKTNHLEEKRIKRLHKIHIAYLDKLPIEFIREYLANREEDNDNVIVVPPTDVVKMVSQVEPKESETKLVKTKKRKEKKSKRKTREDKVAAAIKKQKAKVNILN